ncbi:MAG: flippase-like domain-containing protein [Anaerolineae bacterium]|nr:flippase-like domain-containing protein [Anaerolineae bacterium]
MEDKSELSKQPASRTARKLNYKQLLRWGLTLGVMVIVIWLLVNELSWADVVTALKQADYSWVIIGTLAIIGTFFVRAWRWQALLWQANLPLRPTLTALLVGQAVNTALPMRSGDVVRAVWVSPEKGTNAPEALGSVALEKVWDLFGLLICGLILLAWMPLPGWFEQSTWGTALTLAVGLVLLWVGLRWQEVFFRWIGKLLTFLPTGWDAAVLPRLQKLAQGLESIRNVDASARVFLWTAANSALGILANWAAMRAFGIHSLAAAIFLFVALMLGGAVVPTPGRLGVFEGICVVSLALFGIQNDALALAVGLVLHLIVMVPPLLGAALLAFWPDMRPRNVAAKKSI